MPSMAESRRTLHSLEKSSEAHSIAPQTSLQFTNEYALFIWKGERRKRIGYFSSKISPSSGGDHHKLFAAFLAERSEEHTSELQSLTNLVCRLLLEKKKKKLNSTT